MQYVANKIQTPDGTILQSRHRHDFNSYRDANGNIYVVDGGLDYLRRSQDDYIELSVPITAPFEDIRQAFEWGSYGIDGNQPISYKPLSQLSDDHIAAILKYVAVSTQVELLFKQEQAYRTANNISIKD